MPTYEMRFYDPEPHYGGWFMGWSKRAANIAEARRKFTKQFRGAQRYELRRKGSKIWRRGSDD